MNQSDKTENFEEKYSIVTSTEARFFFLSKPTIELFLKLPNGNMMGLSDLGETPEKAFEKYLAKGANELYLKTTSFPLALNKCRALIEERFDTEKLSTKIEIISLAHGIFRTSLREYGIMQENIQLIRDIGSKLGRYFDTQKEFPTLWSSLFSIPNELLREKLLVSYLVSFLMRTFIWQTENMRDRAILAVFLRDAFLTDEEMSVIKKWNKPWDQLPERLFNHPLDTSKALSLRCGQWLAPDVWMVIEQYCERPLSQGYPKAIGHKNILLLSAIHIVAQETIGTLLMQGGNLNDETVIQSLEKKFENGNYRKVIVPLKKVLKGQEIIFEK